MPNASVARTRRRLQVDLRWDFTHALAGLSASKLAADASWNVCPVGNALHGTACYFDQDRAFETVSGAESLEIRDLPAGQWRVVVRRDYFNKVAGAVRNRAALAAYGNSVVKVEAAHLAALAGLDYEAALLHVRGHARSACSHTTQLNAGAAGTPALQTATRAQLPNLSV